MSEKTQRHSSYIHSFLAGNGWLNDNFTFKRYGIEVPEYKNDWETKQKWYEQHFPGKLIATFEGTDQTNYPNQGYLEK